MYYGIDALQTFCHSGFVGEIAANEPYPTRKDGARLPGGEVVKHDDIVGAVCRQMLYEISTYEAGSARYKYAHTGTSRMRFIGVLRSNRNHHFEIQGIFERSQLPAYFSAISLISPSKLLLSMIGSRPRPIRLRFSTYRSLVSASLRGLGRCEIGTPVNPEIISARSMSLKVSVIWLKMRTRSPF